MSVTDELLHRAEEYAAAFTKGNLPAIPGKRVAILACMDARVNPYRIFGLSEGEAHIIRNAGGAVTDDAIRSLAISQRLLGTEEIILLHHTECGMLSITNDAFAHQIEEETGIRPPWSPEAFTDLDADVRRSQRSIQPRGLTAPSMVLGSTRLWVLPAW